MKPVSVPHKTTGAYQIRSDVSTNPGLSVTSQLNVSTNSRPPLTNQFGGCSVAESMWIDEVDKLCVKVLSNARIRNFVSVNENGNAVLCEIMRYLECQMTMEDVNEELAIPLSEVTPECFNIVHEERALSICRKLMKMNGFERISNCKIPEIPEEIR
ncbi:unnamed protein product [Litomosoides sigmodontis]|uniref:Uncharacterized protein n=1 Tax=Litomosoides sigmodontis TaxID=42156 RepID=A0A3P6UEX8_LITSI|nr:unnamed protein product [Litomosoides sigmodontis]